MYRLYCRLYQFMFRCVAVFLPWRRPERLESMEELVVLLKRKDIGTVLLVTDAGLVSYELHQTVLEPLSTVGIRCVLYDKTVANPTVDNIEEALALYYKEQCEGIVALGGGSPMDCAKGVGARVARPNKSISQLRGQLKVRKKMPLFVAIPTTAGTGSETTVAAVITDSATHEKYAINDLALIPHYAVMDPMLTVQLPPAVTANTGIDALVHAVEAYIGGSNTTQTREDALRATTLIFENLYTAYTDGSNLTARANMQTAAFLAGAAFTRAYVGNVHAIAHTLGGQYNTPHGLANAVILPYVLEAYGTRVHRQLAELARVAGVAEASADDAANAARFIAAVRELNAKMKIPDKLADLKRADIPKLARRALREANPLYPVPKVFNQRDMKAVYELILEDQDERLRDNFAKGQEELMETF